MTREAAFPQLGLSATASEQQVDAAYTAAVAEVEMMQRNARSEALSASYRRARDQLEQAYVLLRKAPAADAVGSQPEKETSAAAAVPLPTAQQVEEVRNALGELRGQSDALKKEMAAIRDELAKVRQQSEALQAAVSELDGQSTREIEALGQVRKRADALLLAAQRNESETATAAMHAEAYRDSAMYAAQAAERLLRALSEESGSV